MLYTLLTNSNSYLDPLIDVEQIDRLVGEVSDETIELHIELNNAPPLIQGRVQRASKCDFSKRYTRAAGLHNS